MHIPEEWLSFEPVRTNELIKQLVPDIYLFGGCCPRPFEQLQFIRGTADLYMDLLDRPKKFTAFLEAMHDFYKRHMEKWALTDCDALNLMDDWGSQRALLINPKAFEEIFLPMYRDYVDIAHKHGKAVFMHSDGYILDIYPYLIDIGVDAVNSQLFCMGVENLKQYKGKITFWGEIDRQNLLPARFGKGYSKRRPKRIR